MISQYYTMTVVPVCPSVMRHVKRVDIGAELYSIIESLLKTALTMCGEKLPLLHGPEVQQMEACLGEILIMVTTVSCVKPHTVMLQESLMLAVSKVKVHTF